MMRKKTRKKGPRPRQSSLARNMALLFLSLGLLAGVSFVFSYFGHRSELSLDPIQRTLDSAFSKEDAPRTTSEQPEPKASSLNPVDLQFYQILNQKDSSAQAQDMYTIQIGAFKSKEKALKLARDLRSKSKLSFRVDKEGQMFCVRWNTFTTVESASKDCEKLSVKLQHECKVVKM